MNSKTTKYFIAFLLMFLAMFCVFFYAVEYGMITSVLCSFSTVFLVAWNWYRLDRKKLK